MPKLKLLARGLMLESSDWILGERASTSSSFSDVPNSSMMSVPKLSTTMKIITTPQQCVEEGDTGTAGEKCQDDQGHVMDSFRVLSGTMMVLANKV